MRKVLIPFQKALIPFANPRKVLILFTKVHTFRKGINTFHKGINTLSPHLLANHGRINFLNFVTQKHQQTVFFSKTKMEASSFQKS